jgi:NADH dehydrogenase
MNILIAGGTGFVGSSLVRRLIADGNQVSLLVRPGSKHKSGFDENLSTIETDFQSLDIPAETDFDAVINCVGIIREFPSRGITFEKVHVENVKYLVELSKRTGIGRFLQVSALGTGPNKKTGYFQTKYKAEELLEKSGLAVTVFRPSIIYGPGDEFINMLAGMMRKFPVMPVIGKGEYRLQPVYIDDLCEIVVRTVGDEFTFGKVFDIGGPEVLTYVEIVDLVGKIIGKRILKFHQPVFFMRNGGYIRKILLVPGHPGPDCHAVR